MRPLSYPQTDIFLVCFSISSRKSFKNVLKKWEPEVSEHCPEVPIILVGTKSDLRKENDERFVSEKEGKKLAFTIGAQAYFECSALNLTGLKPIFELCCRLLFHSKNSKSNGENKNCVLF